MNNEVKIYERTTDGNRGKLLFTSKYPNKKAAQIAKSAYIYLCINQKRYAKEWNLRNVIIA